MKLFGPAIFGSEAPTFLARLESKTEPGSYALRNLATGDTNWLMRKTTELPMRETVCVGPSQDYLDSGDIVKLTPNKRTVHVLYRTSSPSNSLLLSEQCNSRCLMCSQPPRAVDDHHLVDEALSMIPWMDKGTREIGITGGEPTSHGNWLIEVLKSLHLHLPATSVHLLTNGRRLAHLPYARRIAEVGLRDLLLGIPLHSDLPRLHDFIAQAAGAFEETTFGLTNLGRLQVPIELRIVLHRYTASRLESIARFITRNFPFVTQVVFMGIEQVGFTRSNLEALWIDPSEYLPSLTKALDTLAEAEIVTRIYNLPLCILPESMRGAAQQSISDWKNRFLPACEPCSLRPICSGFFDSYGLREFKGIHPQ